MKLFLTIFLTVKNIYIYTSLQSFLTKIEFLSESLCNKITPITNNNYYQIDDPLINNNSYINVTFHVLYESLILNLAQEETLNFTQMLKILNERAKAEIVCNCILILSLISREKSQKFRSNNTDLLLSRIISLITIDSIIDIHAKRK